MSKKTPTRKTKQSSAPPPAETEEDVVGVESEAAIVVHEKVGAVTRDMFVEDVGPSVQKVVKDPKIVLAQHGLTMPAGKEKGKKEPEQRGPRVSQLQSIAESEGTTSEWVSAPRATGVVAATDSMTSTRSGTIFEHPVSVTGDSVGDILAAARLAGVGADHMADLEQAITRGVFGRYSVPFSVVGQLLHLSLSGPKLASEVQRLTGEVTRAAAVSTRMAGQVDNVAALSVGLQQVIALVEKQSEREASVADVYTALAPAVFIRGRAIPSTHEKCLQYIDYKTTARAVKNATTPGEKLAALEVAVHRATKDWADDVAKRKAAAGPTHGKGGVGPSGAK